MKNNFNNTYIVDNVIYSNGYSHEGYSFIRYFLKKNNTIKSFLDIGCGNGILLKAIDKKTDYLGLDANAGIYKKKISKKIKYFKNAKSTENYFSKIKKKI